MELKSFIVLYDGKFIRVYKENEADKVLAELKAQKAQAEDDCAYWKTMSQKCAGDNEVMAKQRAEAFKRERHQKFKRCLDEAKICQLRLERYEQYLAKFKYCNDPTIQRWRFLKDHYEKWYMRWFKIAKQFKPNLTATKENNNG